MDGHIDHRIPAWVFIIICFFVIIYPEIWFAQSPKLQSIVIVTDDLDSMARSYTKQGFSVQPLGRDPVGVLADQVVFPNRSSLVFETPSLPQGWRWDALNVLGRPFVSELRFAVTNIDSVRSQIESAGIGVVLVDSSAPDRGFAIDSTAPVVLVFTPNTLQSSFVKHQRGYYRIDWVILGASEDVEARLRALFGILGFRKIRQGCCDYWRMGSPSDFTFVRFETPQAPWRGETSWLSLGKNALYFAYH